MPDLDLTFGTVRRMGKTFEAGVFADKGVEFTAEDIKNLVNNFTEPVDIKVEHIDTIFDGKLGKAIHLQANADYTNLFGVVEWPEAIDKILEDSDKKISIRTNSDKTKVKEISLVLNPRIPDANLNTLFNTAFSIEKEKDKNIPMTKEEFEKAVKLLAEITPEQKKEFGLAFSETPPKTDDKPETEDITKNPAFIALQKQNEALALNFSQSEAKRLEDQAKAMVEKWEREGKIDPTVEKAKDRAFSILHQAYLDDKKDNEAGITFSETKPSRSSLIEEEYNKKVPLGWDQEMLISDKTFSLPNHKPDELETVRKNTEDWAKQQNERGK